MKQSIDMVLYVYAGEVGALIVGMVLFILFLYRIRRYMRTQRQAQLLAQGYQVGFTHEGIPVAVGQEAPTALNQNGMVTVEGTVVLVQPEPAQGVSPNGSLQVGPNGVTGAGWVHEAPRGRLSSYGTDSAISASANNNNLSFSSTQSSGSTSSNTIANSSSTSAPLIVTAVSTIPLYIQEQPGQDPEEFTRNQTRLLEEDRARQQNIQRQTADQERLVRYLSSREEHRTVRGSLTSRSASQVSGPTNNTARRSRFNRIRNRLQEDSRAARSDLQRIAQTLPSDVERAAEDSTERRPLLSDN